MKELLVLSGKGGTGKTSLTAAFALLTDNVVLADCDVDAADLHLLLAPDVGTTSPFIAGHEAHIRQEDCVKCGACYTRCRFDAISKGPGGAGEAEFTVDPLACEGCGVCVHACPVQAIDFPDAECGEWYQSSTKAGPMVHARLNPGGENSGKLVALVRQEAKRVAQEQNAELILIDGPPGVGCPVIASLGGVSLALVVTEPTLSGEHDLTRVLDLTKHFNVPAAVCINKWDINPQQAERIEQLAVQRGAALAGRVPYTSEFTAALRQGRSVVELDDSSTANSIQSVWATVKGLLP